MLLAALVVLGTVSGQLLPKHPDVYRAAQCPNASRMTHTPGGAGQVASTACDFARNDNSMFRGVAADKVAVISPLPIRLIPAAPTVVAYNRITGASMGELPVPPGGWKMPFGAKSPADGKFTVIDTGGFTNDPSVPVIPFLAEYTRSGGNFTLQRVISFADAPGPVGFIADCDWLPGGGYVCIDQIIGSLWMVNPDGSKYMGLGSGPPPSPPLESLAAGLKAPGDVYVFTGFPEAQPLTFVELAPGGPTYNPGGNYLAYFGGRVYWANANMQRFYSVALSVLQDQSLPPWLKGSSVAEEALFSGMGVPLGKSDPDIIVGGMTFKRHEPSNPELTFVDATNSRVMQLNVQTKAFRAVVTDSHLLEAPSNVAYGWPGIIDGAPLFVSADQEHRLPGLNALIPITSPPGFEPPWMLVKIQEGN